MQLFEELSLLLFRKKARWLAHLPKLIKFQKYQSCCNQVECQQNISNHFFFFSTFLSFVSFSIILSIKVMYGTKFSGPVLGILLFTNIFRVSPLILKLYTNVLLTRENWPLVLLLFVGHVLLTELGFTIHFLYPRQI